jgi:predicted RNA-binding Zn-ribbon protein involved in translation (DUF1610 family)
LLTTRQAERAVKPQCPVCESDKVVIERDPSRPDAANIHCVRCGWFSITGTAELTLKHLKDRYKLSGVLRNASENGQRLDITSQNVYELEARAPTTFSITQLIDRILLLVADRTLAAETLRKHVIIEGDDYPLFYLKSADDLFYIVTKIRDLSLLDVTGIVGAGTPVALTVAGWQRVDQLQAARGRPERAFVAMWFDKSLDDAYSKGIEPALRNTGFDPLRIDRLPHTDRIDDKILAEIRSAGLLVADFTGQRQGVYFEAGFGMGLGIPIIWSCRDSDMENAHFDTRQYNHVVWTDPANLNQQLEARIKALGYARR